MTAATDEAYALARQLHDPAALRQAEHTKAMVANLAGDVETATRFAVSALESSLEAQDLIDTILVCSVLWTIPPGTPGLPTFIPSPEALLQACLDAGTLVEASLLHALLAARALGAGDIAGSARWALRGPTSPGSSAVGMPAAWSRLPSSSLLTARATIRPSRRCTGR